MEMSAAESSGTAQNDKSTVLTEVHRDETVRYLLLGSRLHMLTIIQISYILEKTLESIIHDLVVDVHRSEKIARTQSALVEVQQKADRLAKVKGQTNANPDAADVVIETSAAVYKNGELTLKGNPMTTVTKVLCPSCGLPRLMYPRVGFNSKPVPDSAQQYCKNEPSIILDKHDVHGQRKKGVKMKGQPKNKGKKKVDAASPASSEKSEVPTPSTSSFPNESFEFREIDYPAAKCPNKESHLGDHWKAVNVFATHLNGSCWLKRDRAAGRDAVAKMSGTPRDSRASSPKATNGVKRKAGDDNEGGGKKKQKLDSTPKKNAKSNGVGPSKLREDSSIADSEYPSASQAEESQALDSAVSLQDEGNVGLGLSKKSSELDKKAKSNAVAATTAKKKPPKSGKRA